MTAGVLDVLVAGKLAGTLSQDRTGSLSFAYERDYRGVPLSSSMPLSTSPSSCCALKVEMRIALRWREAILLTISVIQFIVRRRQGEL